MGHYLSGDIPYGQLRRFDRFPVMAWLVGCGEMLMVPRFEWQSADATDDSEPFLTAEDRAALPPWLVPAVANDCWLRVPSQIDPVWFAKESAASLRSVVKATRKNRRGKLRLSLPFAYLLHRRELERALSSLNETLGHAKAPGIEGTLPAPYDAHALWTWHQQHYPAQMRALEARDKEGTYFTLMFAITALLASAADHVFVCDDDTAIDLKDFVKRRFSRLTGSRVAARARLLELLDSTFGALAVGDVPRADKECGYALMYASELAEVNELAAEVYVASARLKALAGDSEQARCDLAWADHLAGESYAGPRRDVAQLVREQI